MRITLLIACLLILVACKNKGQTTILFKSDKLNSAPKNLYGEDGFDLKEYWSEVNDTISKIINENRLEISNFFISKELKIYKIGCETCSHWKYAYLLIVNSKETIFIKDYTNYDLNKNIIKANLNNEIKINSAIKDSLIEEVYFIVRRNISYERSRNKKPF